MESKSVSRDESRDAESAAKLFEQLASKRRLELLMCLLEHDRQNVSELLERMDVKPTTLSNHLGKLAQSGTIKCEQKHRHRYYSIQDPRVRKILGALT